MNQNESFKNLKTEEDTARKMRLYAAENEAIAAGKELFDLDVMDKLWRDNPDKRREAQGLTVSREERIAEWSEIYYVQYPQCRNMSDFVAQMIASQTHGFFD